MNITNEISQSLHKEINTQRKNELLNVARRSFLDYLACIRLASQHDPIRRLQKQLGLAGQSLPIIGTRPGIVSDHAALLNGFASHYLDYDDVQANLRGHPSVVIFSALLALADSQTTVQDVLWAYVEGVEVAGLIGKAVQPVHSHEGWHSTGTVGTIAATAAVSILKDLSREQTQTALSIATSEAAGMRYQSGTDTKPLHAGLAARNALTAYQLTLAGLTADQDPFSNEYGWIKTISGQKFAEQDLETWLSPAQIESPGIWYKQHQFCSAAISAYDAAEKFRDRGVDFATITQIIAHYPVDGDKALMYAHPTTGQEAKFSIEYIIWKVLSDGDVDDAEFDQPELSAIFHQQQHLFSRVHDLANEDLNARPIALEIVAGGQSHTETVKYAKGSPDNPLSTKELVGKVRQAFGIKSDFVVNLIQNNSSLITQIQI